MVKRIFPSRPGPPKSTPAGDETTPAAPASGDVRTVKSRVLGSLGFLPLTKRVAAVPAGHGNHAASLMPSRLSQTPVNGNRSASAPTAGSEQDKMLEDAVRAALPGLGSDEASRFERLLGHALRAGDPARQTMLLKMLEANVRTVVAQRGAALLPATVWQSLAQTSVNVYFQGSVASMLKAKEAQLLRLQQDIQKLPPSLAAGYQTLLRDILASKGAAKRDALLGRMARQVAARTNSASET